MNNSREFCAARAEEARRDADTADLDNVRDRHLRAAAAWDVLGARAARTMRLRAEIEAKKAAAAAAPLR